MSLPQLQASLANLAKFYDISELQAGIDSVMGELDRKRTGSAKDELNYSLQQIEAWATDTAASIKAIRSDAKEPGAASNIRNTLRHIANSGGTQLQAILFEDLTRDDIVAIAGHINYRLQGGFETPRVAEVKMTREFLGRSLLSESDITYLRSRAGWEATQGAVMSADREISKTTRSGDINIIKGETSTSYSLDDFEAVLAKVGKAKTPEARQALAELYIEVATPEALEQLAKRQKIAKLHAPGFLEAREAAVQEFVGAVTAFAQEALDTNVRTPAEAEYNPGHTLTKLEERMTTVEQKLSSAGIQL